MKPSPESSGQMLMLKTDQLVELSHFNLDAHIIKLLASREMYLATKVQFACVLSLTRPRSQALLIAESPASALGASWTRLCQGQRPSS